MTYIPPAYQVPASAVARPVVQSGGVFTVDPSGAVTNPYAATAPSLADYQAMSPQYAKNSTSIISRLQNLAGGGGFNSEAGGGLNMGGVSASGLGEAATGLFSPLSPTGIKAGLAGYTGNGIGGALRTAGGRFFGQTVPLTTAGLLASNGLDAVGAPAEASSAAQYAGAGAGAAAMLGPEAIVPGAILGGAYGALKGPITDLSNVGDYSKQVDTWNKAFNKIPDKSTQDQLGRWAVDAHKGHWNVLADHIAKNAPQFLGAFQQTVANSSGIDRHTQVLKFLTQIARTTTATNAASTTASKQQKSAIDKDTARRMAIQNAALQAVQPMVNSTLGSGELQAQMAQNMPGLPAGVAEADAAQRRALAQQQANAFQGAVYAQPLIDQIQSQIALNNQYLQQLQASTGKTGSNDIADALKAAGITPKK